MEELAETVNDVFDHLKFVLIFFGIIRFYTSNVLVLKQLLVLASVLVQMF